MGELQLKYIHNMLIPRILTTVALLATLFVLVMLQDAIYFAVFMSLAAAITLFEWVRIALGGQKKGAALAVAIVFFLLCVRVYPIVFQGKDSLLAVLTDFTLLQQHPTLSIAFSMVVACTFFVAFVWVFIVPFVLYRADTSRPQNRLYHIVFALLSTLTTWFSVIACYLLFGAWFLVSFLMIIWCADIFAYVGGKYVGGKKLVPAISPGKTQSGAIIGLLAVVVWMLVSAQIEHSFASLLLARIGVFWLIAVGMLMGLLSIGGDLYESLLKRRAQVKDASALLPGHGGVWDRLDSVVAVSPIAMVFVFLLYI